MFLNPNPPEAILVGRLRREYLLPFNQPACLDVLGGNLAYAAAGMALWGGKAGLVTRVNTDFPIEIWLDPFVKQGFDLEGVSVVNGDIDHRHFVAYSDPITAHFENPMTWFAERNLPFPPELLGYDLGPSLPCSKTEYAAYSFRVNDLPRDYLEAHSAHICPIDFISHKLLPSLLKTGMIQTLSMRASACYMDPVYWSEMHGLLSDLTVFMLQEKEALKLFQGRSQDLWEISMVLAGFGPEYVLLNTADGAVMVYDRIANKRWIVPAYPVKMVDPTGCVHAFDGGFLLNYRKGFNILEGVLHGQVSSAFCAEGSGSRFVMEAMPALRDARLEALRPRIREI